MDLDVNMKAVVLGATFLIVSYKLIAWRKYGIWYDHNIRWFFKIHFIISLQDFMFFEEAQKHDD
jgi:hypothetical protein